jgi:putative transposase
MTMSAAYRSSDGAKFAVFGHLVLTTKYRRQVITGEVMALLQREAKEAAEAVGAEILAIDGEADHVHVLLAYPPTVALSRLVQRIKGRTSRIIRQARFPGVRRRLWGNAFWSPSYFVVSCGGAPLDIIRRYVETQQRGPLSGH